MERDVTGRFKSREQYFTRGGPLRPALLVSVILRMVSQGDRRGYRPLLDEVWEEAREQGVDLGTDQPVTAEAFCRARQRLRSEVFEHLLGETDTVLDRDPLLRRDLEWKGRRLFAADGCTLTVRRSGELREHFGSAEGSYYPQVSVVVLADVLARVPYGVRLGPYGIDERAALLELSGRLEPGDVLLLDRGFPSHEVIDALARLGVDFVMRVSAEGSFREIEEFLASGQKERTFLFTPRSQIDPELPTRLRLRLVRCERPGQEPFVLLTSLPSDVATRTELDALYHQRWSIEELFKLPKGLYLHQRQFHSKHVDGVRQEILALLLYIALSQIMRLCAARDTEHPAQDYSQKAALLGTARFLVGLTLGIPGEPLYAALLARLLERIRRRLDRRRPDRRFPRRSLQPRPRWDASGRTGLG